MPLLNDLKAANFDHYQYASRVKSIVEETFPEFATVDFGPIRADGASTQYADLGMPAFLMTFLAPDLGSIRPMQPMLDADGAGLLEKVIEADTPGTFVPETFVQMRIRVSGVLFLPMNPALNDRLKDDVSNIDIYEAAAATALIVAIKSRFIGLQTADCEIESVETRFESLEEDTEIYRATEIIWSSEVVIGWQGKEASFALHKLFADVDALTLGVSERVLQSDPADPIEEWEQDANGNWLPKDP